MEVLERSESSIENEIERRFLTVDPCWKSLAENCQHIFIEQAYPKNLQRDDSPLRVRKSTFASGETKFERCTKKKGDGLITYEETHTITPIQAKEMFIDGAEQNLKKWRWLLACDGVIIEVDNFTHIRNERVLNPFVISEIEFDSEEAAEAFDPPAWLGAEITGDPRYSNYGLCLYGQP